MKTSKSTVGLVVLPSSSRAVHCTARRGAVIPLVAITLVGILGLAALSVDAGNLFRERRNTQTAADAAADAGGLQLLSDFEKNAGVDSDGRARATALSLAAAHGYQKSDVTVNIPPLSGAFARQKGFVEVIITTRPQRFFSGIFGSSAPQVQSRAVAAGTMLESLASVVVLDPKSKKSLHLKGKNTSLEVGGDIIVNSSHKRAVEAKKRSQITAENLLVTGGLSKNSKRNIDAEVKTGVPPIADPLRSLPIPPKGPALNAESLKATVSGKDVYNLLPGTYKELKFDKNDVVRMAPGVYYVDGGGVELKGNASLDASQVMIYNAGKRGVKIKTQGKVEISPQRVGTYKGISIFQSAEKKTKVDFRKQTRLEISGIIYAPSAEVRFRGSDIDLESGDDDESDDGDDDDDDEQMDDDFGTSDASSINAAIIARKLSVGKKTRLTIMGRDITGFRPLLGVVE